MQANRPKDLVEISCPPRQIRAMTTNQQSAQLGTCLTPFPLDGMEHVWNDQFAKSVGIFHQVEICDHGHTFSEV
jgi:hypothetical protein